MPSLGEAYLQSQSNKKCNASVCNITVGVFMDIPKELRNKMDEWEKEFGNLPTDLQFGWNKY